MTSIGQAPRSMRTLLAMIPTRPLSELDRRAGRAVRDAVGRRPEMLQAAQVGSAAFAPAFRIAVAVAVLDRDTRREGLNALLSAGTAAGVALLARDAIGRPRPGDRRDAGFPSRHAAAGAAIAASASKGTGAGAALWLGTALGSACRVATGEHEVGDVVAGAALGVLVATSVNALARAGR